MKKLLQIFFVCVFLSVSSMGFSSHLAGGTLTYVHNGGSSYTITLKIYRFCNASYQFTNQTINVGGYNGIALPSITMTLTQVNAIPAILPPCAISPSPMPCIQEGVYTKTVTNLPPIPGGYHLSCPVIYRSLGIVNSTIPCNCVSMHLYADIPGIPIIWGEDFTLPNNTTVDNAGTAWSRTLGPPAPGAANVQSNLFRVTGASNASATWSSQIIPISSCSSVNLSVDLSKAGTLTLDKIFVYYKLNGGPLTLFPTNGTLTGNFTPVTASKLGIAGSTVQIVIRVQFIPGSSASKIYQFDNVLVTCNNFVTNNDPVFKLYPPVLLCAGQPFTFDHSAIDSNGDSLVYSLYTPYKEGAPTFSGNIATFTPVVWNPGYSATNPLGGAPLNLNASTGVLTGTPGILGRFIVGVMVKDYRNGVYMSQTLRDFEYQVVSCPQPPPPSAGTNISVNQGCNSPITATGYADSSVTWNSIYPGALGAYNSYLSCTSGCLNPTATAQSGAPPYVDYQICGQSSTCNNAPACDTARVTFNPPLSVTIAPQNPVLCVGQTSTTITATGSGGTPPYTYLWNNLNPSPSILVGNGTYTIQLSDGSGCPPAFATVTVTSFSVAITSNAGADKTVCKATPITTINGSVTGALSGIWSGGGGVFSPNNTTLSATYSPTPAELTNGFVDLTLTTTGNGTCPAASDIVRITYIPFSGVVSFTQPPISCFGGNDGSATVNITGGMSPYTYSWNTSPAQSTQTATNLALGTYSVTITNSMGCTSTNPVSITQPTPLALSSSITNVSCSGGNNGSISINATGGTGPYTYLWNNGATTALISNLTAQSYSITVTDSKNCTKTSTYTITEPSTISISLTPTPVSCFNGSNGTANSTVSGGTLPYTYNWSSGATSPNASGLQAGPITLTVTDVAGCFASNSVTIVQPTALIAGTSKTDETCSDLNNGSATAILSGGTPGYTFLWQPGAQTTGTISNLSSGTYTLIAKDLNGCQATTFAVIAQPTPLTINFISQVNVSCFGGNNGSVIANPAGGNGTFTYLWSNGATTSQISNLSAQTYSVTITDANGCDTINSVVITQPTIVTASTTSTDETCGSLNNGTAKVIASGGTPTYTYLWQPGLQTTDSIYNLSSGNHTLTVTDSKGCTGVANATITEPSPIAISFTAQTNVSCYAGADGSVTASPAGGTPLYTYLWAPGGATSATTSNLSAGTYSVTITDSKGCFLTNSVVITQPSPLGLETSVTNETCNSLNDGTATVDISGGTPGYTYLWQPGSLTTLSINNLSSGTYTLTVTDSNGCAAIANPVITEPPPFTISFASQTNVSCFGENDGSVTASSSGGTPNYSYLWAAGGGTTSSRINLTAGTYSVTVTDAKGCFTTNSVIITQPPLLVVSASSLPATCYGATDGSVSSSATSGTGPYTYSWMPGSLIGQNVSNLAGGTYTVTATDSLGCVSSNSISVAQPAQIILTTTSVNSDCGLPNGQSSVSVSGGNDPYTYFWSPAGGTNDTAIGLLTGAYTVIVTDSIGCTASQFGNVNENAAPVATIFSVINVSCFGGTNGSAKVGTIGGIGPFTYSWMPSGGTDSIATGLTAGSYTVTVTGSNGCKSLATTSPDITQPSPILIAVTKTPVSCFGGNDGTAAAVISGGTPGYTYQWLPGGTMGLSVSNLSATSYTVQVTDTNSCVETTPFTITQAPSTLSASLTFTPSNCFGGSDGSVSATAIGGTAPYNYNWMPGNFNAASISNLSSGSYTLTLTDLKGCIYNNSITVTQPTQVILTSDSINSNCSLANGQASVTASGGAGGYLYLWSPSGGTNSIAPALLAGAYTVKVTDGNGCISTDGVTVNNNASPVASVFSTSNVTCNAGSNGTAIVSVTGGTGPFTYSWMPSGNTDSIATGLLPGTYTVTVTDANLCQSAPAISPEITQPYPILITVTKTSVTCFGDNDGTASATASGGAPTYSYLWSNGSTSTLISNLSAQTYTIQVTDFNNCVQSLPVIINEPGALNLVIPSVTNVTCYGLSDGTATATVSGGTMGYTYNWFPLGGNGPVGTGLSDGTYTLTVTDFNGCVDQNSVAITQPSQALSATNTVSNITCFGASNGTAGIHPVGGTTNYTYQWNPSASMNDTASGLASGNYTVLIADNNGCETNLAISITEPSEIGGSLVSVNPSCGLSNGSISSQLSGGVLPYTYLWSYGAATTSSINGLGTGVYNLTVTDASGCTKSLSSTLTFAPDPSIAVSTLNNVSCFGGNDGSATINITQGTAPYTINWSPSGGNGLTASVLSIGTYTINVTDALGCLTMDSIIIAEPTPVDVSISSVTDVLCNGGSTGSISVAPSGGTGPLYTYLWAPGGATSATATDLSIGTYTVNVMDQNNCFKAISATITEPTSLSSAVDTIIHATCFNGFGSASVIASGGVLPYSYSWSAPAIGQTGSEANNLIAGSYTITITDTNGCVTSTNLIVKHPLQVMTSTGANDTLCLGQTGSVSATAVGGAGNYYYTWQPSGAITSGTLPITPTSNTTYTVVAFDQIGCAGTPDTVTAIVYNLTAANIQALGTTPICPGASSVIYVETSGTTGPLTYQWNNNLGTGTGIFLVTPAQPTTYIVTVSNMCGLSVSDSVEVLFNPPPTIALSSAANTLCVPGYMPFFDNSVTGNIDDPITGWEWNFGDGTTSNEEDPDHNYAQPGDYLVTLTVTTSGGCTNNNLSAPIAITAHPIPTAAFSINSTNLNLPYDVLILNNQSVGATSYYWEFGDAGTSTQFNPQYVYTSLGVFQVQLIAMSQYGCVDTAFAEITTDADVVFPNAFTPNPNGSQGGIYDLNNLSNDIFFPYSSGVIDFKIEIFNRWGEEIFESLDIKQGWDGYYRGAICQQDVYVFKAYVKLNNGKVFYKNGDVTLLRY
ncbi:MAG: PKD domain-containing protein [Bacteroidia bacterium]|nr:PKD domain-containing protein [Bacteroidia bacterium]